MSFYEKINTSVGNFLLQKKMASVIRNRKLVNLYSTSAIGILFELSDPSVYQAVHQYIHRLQENKIKAKALGYTSNKLMTDQFLPVLTFDFFSNKQLSLFQIPKAKLIQDFTETEFDICINISSEKVFPLKYVAASSKAKLKAGSYCEDIPGQGRNDPSKIYDILLQTQPDHDQVRFLENIHEYLTILKPTGNA